ncbi:MAG: hypothetical protein FWF03_06625 [Defluviitaleaceae bacterium]|nr:hypothetical protein [Defluviitaleaceae bacterium]
MAKTKKLLALLIVFMFAFAAVSACSNKDDSDGSSGTTQTAGGADSDLLDENGNYKVQRTLKLTAVIDQMYVPTWKDDPVPDDTLQKLVRQGIINSTKGVDVQIEWIMPLTDTTRQEYLNLIISAGTVPDLLMMGDLANDPNSLELVQSKEIIRTVNKAMLNEFMPTYSARIDRLDGDLNAFLSMTEFNGENLYIPLGFNSPFFSKVDLGLVPNYTMYGLYVRDDVLKMVFPNARTEEEQRALFIQKGELTIEDITGDIPIRNMSDMYDFCKKVKDLNIKVNGKDLIPAMMFRSNEMPDSTLWSLSTAAGQAWLWPLFFENDILQSEQMYASKRSKEYHGWLNKMFNDGLIDPETFVMKDDQSDAKAVNGEYAVFPVTSGLYSDAKAVGDANGYGYRYLPAFYPLDQTVLGNQILLVLPPRGYFITTSVKDEDLAAVFGWFDYYLSEQHDQLRCWGSPDWLTFDSNGKPNGYKPEYKHIENYVLYGDRSDNDGEKYHMTTPYPLQGVDLKNDPLMNPPIPFMGSIATYEHNPYYILDLDGSKLENTNIASYSQITIGVELVRKQTTYMPVGWTLNGVQYTEEMTAFDNEFWVGSRLVPLLAKAVTAKDFEAGWKDFIDECNALGLAEAVRTAAEGMNEVFWDPAKNIPLN